MINISLSAIPNQSLTIQLDGFVYDLTFKETNGVMSAWIIRDNLPIVQGLRLVGNSPMLPYLYQEAGNFALLTLNNDYPDFNQFGTTQNLVYLSQSELDVIRAA